MALNLSSIFWLCLWFFGIAFLISYFMRWYPGDNFKNVRFINYFMPWLLIVLVPIFMFSLLNHQNWLAVIYFLSISLICMNYLPFFIKNSPVIDVNELFIKVMSYNIWSKNKNLNAATKLIKSVQPDILLLQEIGPKYFEEVRESLEDLYTDCTLYFDYAPQINQAIISRFPIEPLGMYRNKGRIQKVRIETPFGKVVVLNIHAFKCGWLHRHKQTATLLKEDIINEKRPIILGGDFNTSDQSQTCRMINRHLKNAHWEAGGGFGFSYPAIVVRVRGFKILRPLIRIDHIYFSNQFNSSSALTLNKSGGSDHFPVVADLVVN
ncbi:endonuclease/exonuclease/phosphatase family protein [Thermodesulfobacteriota bacterium]